MEPGSSVDARMLHMQPRPTVALGSRGALAVVWDAERAWASRMCVLGAQLVARGSAIYDHALGVRSSYSWEVRQACTPYSFTCLWFCFVGALQVLGHGDAC